jgi:hypothetical protein
MVEILAIGNRLPKYVHLMDLVGWQFDCSKIPGYPIQEFHVDGEIRQYVAGYRVGELNKIWKRKNRK